MLHALQRAVPRWSAMGLVVVGSAFAVAPGHAAPADTARTAAWFDAHKARAPLLRGFLQRMPKGADLHSHLSGAVYAESYLRWAADDGLCVDTVTLRFLRACDPDNEAHLPARELPTKSGAYNALVDRMSTRNLASAWRSGHDQFFDAFSAFPPGPGTPERLAAMAGEVADRAARQQVLHLELMNTLRGDAVRELGSGLPWAAETDFARRLQWLQAQGLAQLVDDGRKDLDAADAAYRQHMQCGTPQARPGCTVSVRWLQQSTRTGPPEQVFAQLGYAFALAAAEPRVVGLNLVAPEDHPIALRDHALQMAMIGFLSRHWPQVRIALHAGELTLGLVPPEHLRDHIEQAVQVAGAHRIGHAVSIGHEDQARLTMAAMRRKGVAAEICLTSNDVILGVKGAGHPLPDYLAAGVPVVLASDDEGVSRIDLSNEYLRAAQEHGLRYRQLKQISRNSLEHSFLPGASLWRDLARGQTAAACSRDSPGRVRLSAACRALLDTSERARRQWALEQAFERFEQLPDWRAAAR